MPRIPTPITHEFPYHIVARSNNKEWFYLSTSQTWKVFSELLTIVSIRFNFQIHAFLLMNNHYHLIGTASKEFPLPKVMEWLQRSANRTINNKTGRINHLFGGPYRASLITTPEYYFHAIKYLYRNPITACTEIHVEKYKYSTLVNSKIPLTSPITGIESMLPKSYSSLLQELNNDYSNEAYLAIKTAIKKPKLKFNARLNANTYKELRLS